MYMFRGLLEHKQNVYLYGNVIRLNTINVSIFFVGMKMNQQ